MAIPVASRRTVDSAGRRTGTASCRRWRYSWMSPRKVSHPRSRNRRGFRRVHCRFFRDPGPGSDLWRAAAASSTWRRGVLILIWHIHCGIPLDKKTNTEQGARNLNPAGQKSMLTLPQDSNSSSFCELTYHCGQCKTLAMRPVPTSDRSKARTRCDIDAINISNKLLPKR